MTGPLCAECGVPFSDCSCPTPASPLSCPVSAVQDDPASGGPLAGTGPLADNGSLSPDRRGPRTEAQEYAAFVRRIVAAMGRRAADHDIEALPVLVDLAKLVDSTTVVVVANLHAQGFSWTEIGDRLGITRQAARQRYAPRIGEAGQ